MSKRQKAMPEEIPVSEAGPGDEEVHEEPPPETRRTRSGRTVRRPASLLESEAPVRTPARRTRRSVLQELPPVEEKNTEEPKPRPEDAKLGMSAEPEAQEQQTEAAAHTDRVNVNVNGGADPQPAGPDPATEKGPKTSETVPKKKPCLGASGRQTPVVPLGKPKSGRVWKNRNKQRFSAVVRDKQLCSSWEKKMQAKRDKDLLKQYALQLKEEKAKQKEDKRKRREENLKRRAENERKAEIVQVIKNTTKIKRMKKKQLRKIEKRDTLALLQKSQKQTVKAKGQKINKADPIST